MDASSSFVVAVLTLHSVSAMCGCSSVDLPAAQASHRRLLQEEPNLAARRSEHYVPVPVAPRVPSLGSGSFPASNPHGRNHPSKGAPAPSATGHSNLHGSSRSGLKWLYKAVLPAVGLLLLTGLACLLLPCRKSAVATIGPWKTGLSGQLQKAFVTGTTLFAQFHTCAVQMCSTIFYTSYTSCQKWKRIKLPIALLILRKFTCSFQKKKEEGSPDTLLSDFTFETQLAA